MPRKRVRKAPDKDRRRQRSAATARREQRVRLDAEREVANNAAIAVYRTEKAKAVEERGLKLTESSGRHPILSSGTLQPRHWLRRAE